MPSGNITVASDFTTGVITDLQLPEETGNQPTVAVRWVMRSNLQVNTGNVASGGTSRIDDISISGSVINTANQYSLTLSKVGNGTLNPAEGISNYNSGTTVTLTATPDQGWVFDKWEINGNTVTSSTTNVTINSNTTAKAIFSLANGVSTIENLMTVYPNPFTSTITVECVNGIKDITIMDLQGRILAHYNNIAKTELTVDLSHLPSGAYILKLTEPERSTKTIKIVK